jgi:hypothetical protein
VLMVDPDQKVVEQRLLSGGLNCPRCVGVLRPWSFARWRIIRGLLGEVFRFRPRRSRCSQCLRTHVLLPHSTLLRRAYSVKVILIALTGKADELGHRKIARDLDVPTATVRGWLRRFAGNAKYWRELFTRLRDDLDPEPGPIQPQGSQSGDAVEVIGLAGAAAVRAKAWSGPVWGFVAVASAGLLLAPNPRPVPVSVRGSP